MSIYELKANKIKISQIIKKYLIYQVKLKTITISNKDYDKMVIVLYENYINYINMIFSNMNQEYARIIKGIYLDKSNKHTLGYSMTAFYIKYKKALSDFLDFYEEAICQ